MFSVFSRRQSSLESNLERMLTNIINNEMNADLEQNNSGLSDAAMRTLRENSFTVTETDDNTQCSICLETIQQNETVVTLECQHTFHLQCIERWCSSHNSCPICRSVIEEHEEQEQSIPNIQTQRIIVNNITTIAMNIRINDNTISTYWYSYNTMIDVFNYLSQMQNRYIRMMIQVGNKIFKTTESYEYLILPLSEHGIRGRVEAQVHFF